MEKIKINRRQKQAGLTLVEIIITITIATILISTTAPSLSNIIQNNRMVSLHNDLMSDLAATRSSAVTRGNSATICASNQAGNSCLMKDTIAWRHGWIVFDDISNDGVIDSGEEILIVRNNIPEQLSLIGDYGSTSFDSEGSAFGYSNTFAFCDARGESAKKGLIVSNSGRSRVAKANEISVSCL